MTIEQIVLDQLKEGKNQKEIAKYLATNEMTPHSLSSVEKAILALKKKHKANTLFQLGMIIQKQTKK